MLFFPWIYCNLLFVKRVPPHVVLKPTEIVVLWWNMMCNFCCVLTGLVSDRPRFLKMHYTITGSEWWEENYAHCFIFHVRGRNQTSKEKKVGTKSGQTAAGSWRFSSLKGKAFQSSFQVSWFLGFLFHSDLGYGPAVSTWDALRHSFNLGGVWNIRQ